MEVLLCGEICVSPRAYLNTDHLGGAAMSANASSLPEAQASAPINHFARITGVFFTPKATFTDIVAAPTWIVPMVVLVMFSLIAVTALNQRMDWRQYATQQIEKNSQSADLSAEQKERQIQAVAKFAPISAY